MNEYYINNDTLILIPIDKNTTKVFDIYNFYIIYKNIFEIIDESCQYYGSSYGGRYIGSKRLLNMEYKLPIIINESKEIIMFPTCSPKSENCCWISLNNIENYEKTEFVSTLKFNNGIYYETDISYNSLENQYLRANLLLMKLKKINE